MSLIQPFTGAFIITSGSWQEWKCPCRWSQITLWMAANVQQWFSNHEVRYGISTEATSIWSQPFKSMTPFLFFCCFFTGAELLAFYNNPPVREGQVKYYTVKVPLRVQNCDEGVKGVEANWLDHMTHHFNNGASLVDGHFYLGNVNGKPAWLAVTQYTQYTTIWMRGL